MSEIADRTITLGRVQSTRPAARRLMDANRALWRRAHPDLRDRFRANIEADLKAVGLR